MDNLKFSLVILMNLFAVTVWSSVILEEKPGESAPVPGISISQIVGASAAVEDTEKQGVVMPPPGSRPKRCPLDEGNCYQTTYCKRNCRITNPTNAGENQSCESGGLGQYCEHLCRYLKGTSHKGSGDGCFCHCYQRKQG